MRLTARSRTLGELTASGDLSLGTGRYDLRLGGDLDRRKPGSAPPCPPRSAVGGGPRPSTSGCGRSRCPYGLDLAGPLVADATLRRLPSPRRLALGLDTGQLTRPPEPPIWPRPQLDTLSIGGPGAGPVPGLAAVVEGRASGRAAADGLLGRRRSRRRPAAAGRRSAPGRMEPGADEPGRRLRPGAPSSCRPRLRASILQARVDSARPDPGPRLPGGRGPASGRRPRLGAGQRPGVGHGRPGRPDGRLPGRAPRRGGWAPSAAGPWP